MITEKFQLKKNETKYAMTKLFKQFMINMTI